MKLSVILPTCKRINGLRKMLDSLFSTTQMHDIEVIALIDDDIKSAQVAMEYGCKVDYSDSRRNVLSLWNKGLQMSTGDMIHPAMDDLIYYDNWLDYGLESHSSILGGCGVIGFNDLAYNGNTQVATQFMFDRMYCKWYMGGVIAPPVYEYLCIDLEINDVAKSVGKFYWDERAIVEHAHSAHGKREYDIHDQWKDENKLAEADGKVYEERKKHHFPVTWEPMI